MGVFAHDHVHPGPSEARAARRGGVAFPVIAAARVPKPQRYERRRKAENVEALALVDGLHRLFRLRAPELGGLRELGMSLVGRVGMVKAALAKRAMRI